MELPVAVAVLEIETWVPVSGDDSAATVIPQIDWGCNVARVFFLSAWSVVSCGSIQTIAQKQLKIADFLTINMSAHQF